MAQRDNTCGKCGKGFAEGEKRWGLRKKDTWWSSSPAFSERGNVYHMDCASQEVQDRNDAAHT